MIIKVFLAIKPNKGWFLAKYVKLVLTFYCYHNQFISVKKEIAYMSLLSKIQNTWFRLCCALVFVLSAQTVFADDSLPWESPLQKILHSLTGPVAKILGVIAIVIAGFGIAFGEAGSGVRRLFQVIFGLSIVFSAATLVVSLFGVSSNGIGM